MISPISAQTYTSPSSGLARLSQTGESVQKSEDSSNDEVKKTFTSVFGEMLYFEMLKGMRKTQEKPAYFHGGQAEEVFTQQLDQIIAKKMADTSGEALLGHTFDVSRKQFN